MNETKPQEYDPAKLLTLSALFFVGVLILFVSGIIAAQIWQSGEANTESWAALTGLIGWATSQVSIIFSNRYGTTQQSSAKDTTIAQQARSQAIAQDALLDPNVTVTNTAKVKQASALLPDTPAVPPTIEGKQP